MLCSNSILSRDMTDLPLSLNVSSVEFVSHVEFLDFSRFDLLCWKVSIAFYCEL